MRKQREFDVGDKYDEVLSRQEEEVRVDTLKGIAYSVKQETYTKNLTEEELVEKKSLLSEVCIEIQALEDKKKEFMDELKIEMDPNKATKKELLSAIKFKSEQRTGHLFYIDDQENGFMYVFDKEGVCIDSRPLKPSERQSKIKNLNTGTNG